MLLSSSVSPSVILTTVCISVCVSLSARFLYSQSSHITLSPAGVQGGQAQRSLGDGLACKLPTHVYTPNNTSTEVTP